METNMTENGEEFDLLAEILSGKWDHRQSPEELAEMCRKDTLEEAQRAYGEYRSRVLGNYEEWEDNEYLRVVRGSDNVEGFVCGIRGLIENHRAVRDDWASRSYKRTKKVVEVYDRSDAFTIAEEYTNRLSTNYINERRRLNRVDHENREIDRLQQDLECVLGKYLLERFDRYVLNGTPAERKTA